MGRSTKVYESRIEDKEYPPVRNFRRYRWLHKRCTSPTGMVCSDLVRDECAPLNDGLEALLDHVRVAHNASDEAQLWLMNAYTEYMAEPEGECEPFKGSSIRNHCRADDQRQTDLSRWARQYRDA